MYYVRPFDFPVFHGKRAQKQPIEKGQSVLCFSREDLECVGKKEVGVAISGGIKRGSGELFPLLS